MTDTERIDALEAFVPGMVWVRNQVRDKGLLSSISIPVRPVSRGYAVKFQVKFWDDFRQAIDAWISDGCPTPK